VTPRSRPRVRVFGTRRRATADGRNRLDLWRDGSQVLGILWSDDGAYEVAVFVRGPWEDEALALAM
jgi:hypothetical protein